MQFYAIQSQTKRKKADALVLPLWKIEKQKPNLSHYETLTPQLKIALESGDFKGKEGEILCLYLEKQPEQRLLLLGLGPQEKGTTESIRRSYGALTKACQNKQLNSLNILMPEDSKLDFSHLLRGMVEGLLLPNYIFNQMKHPDKEEKTLLKKVTWIGLTAKELATANKILIVCETVNYARDLVNGNADDITPQKLASCAKEAARKFPHIKTTVFDKSRIEKEKMGLLLAVNRGSAQDPVFIIMEYKGNPKSKDHTVLVGKGITYDTGGLNLKPTGAMETMKCDMGGAATCIGTVMAAARLHLKCNITAVIPSTENAIDAKSFKPGDVYSSYLGKTVEITNTDAEGRLILADGLAYAEQKLKPTRLIDFGTLTGAIDIALGAEATGLMSNDDDLAEALHNAGEATFERVWRMPLYDEYKERLKSDIADIKNWNGRSAGASIAAIFLLSFISKTSSWAHLDIASTAYGSEAKKYQPKFATGVGIRLMIEFLESLNSSKKKKTS